MFGRQLKKLMLLLRDMGKVMRVVPQVKGKADGTRVQAAVKEIL